MAIVLVGLRWDGLTFIEMSVFRHLKTLISWKNPSGGIA